MTNKYFTPSIEDIRVGYECEIQSDYEKPDDWCKVFLDSTLLLRIVSKEKGMMLILPGGLPDKFGKIRVPYLTKEQIEAEGWKEEPYRILFADFGEKDSSKDYYAHSFRKDNYSLYYNTGSKLLSIIVTDPSLVENSDFGKMPIFRGECKDINTFRYICKLLGI